MAERCGECGARIPERGSCRQHFEALLALEWSIPNGSGELAHFLAVATYILQHPESMGYAKSAHLALCASLQAVLDGEMTLEQLRRQTHQNWNGKMRLFRRDDEPAAPVKGVFSMTITDALASKEEQDAYTEIVKRWAKSALEEIIAS